MKSILNKKSIGKTQEASEDIFGEEPESSEGIFDDGSDAENRLEGEAETESGPENEAAALSEEEKNRKKDEIREEIYSYARLVLICCVIALLVRFITPLIFVDGTSMSDTLYHRELCIGCTLLTPRRGQIITFKNSTQTLNKTYIKRVIGIPGDTIAIRDHVVYLNGEKLEEDYAFFFEDQGSKDYYSDIGEFTLGKDEYFVCGDNRYNSRDSRIFGPVLKEDIDAVILLPLDIRWITGPVKKLVGKD